MLQTTTSSFLRKDDQLELAINVHGENIGALIGRLGYTKQGDTVTASQGIRGLISYPDISGGTTRLFAGVNGDFKWYDGSSAWTTAVSYGVVDADVNAKVFLDKLFICGANATNDYITTTIIDGVTPLTGGDVTDAPSARYIEVFKDRLFLADIKISGTRYGSRFYESSPPDVDTLAITWPSTNWDEILANNGESIMGLHANRALNQLLLFKENSIHAYDLTTIRDVGAVGTSSHRSIQTINFITFWFKKGEGIYAYSGIQPQLISRGIEKWIRGIQGTCTPFAAKEYERIYRLYVGDIVVDGATYTNCEIRYCVPDNTFTIYSWFDNITSFAPHTVAGVQRVYGGTSTGEVHEFAQGTDAVYTDNGEPIAGEFMTKAFDFGRPGTRHFIDKIMVYSSNAQNITGRVRAKGRDWSTFFALDQSEQLVNINPDEGRFHQFHFSWKGGNAPPKIEGFTTDPLETSSFVHTR